MFVEEDIQEAIHDAEKDDGAAGPRVHLGVPCGPTGERTAVRVEADAELAEDKDGEEDAEDLVVRVKVAGLEGKSV